WPAEVVEQPGEVDHPPPEQRPSLVVDERQELVHERLCLLGPPLLDEDEPQHGERTSHVREALRLACLREACMGLRERRGLVATRTGDVRADGRDPRSLDTSAVRL